MICVVDYGMGNLRSVSKALEKLGGKVEVSSSPASLRKATKIVLPGVGAFGDGFQELKRRGLVEPLLEGLREEKPFLGVCLGMQLLFERSEESPGTPGLSFFRGEVKRFSSKSLKIPHMGWNQMKIQKRDVPLFQGVADQSYFYFVHSFYPVPEDRALVAGTSEYGEEFPSVIGKGKIWASQFHPEKSQATGLKILENFLAL
jgi:glutamine amidotransferase